MSNRSNYRTVNDTDNWRPGYTLMICEARGKVPHLPIDVDYLMFRNCTFDVLDLTWLDDESLKTLTIEGCTIREIRGLSQSTKHLHISNSSVEILEIPPNLEELDYWMPIDSHNTHPIISAFPAETLKILSLCRLNLSELLPLPVGLKKLCLTGCNVPLPNPMPPTLNDLICCEMEYLTELPPLPASLTYLDCSDNAIKKLPELPLRLQYLDCSSNSISGELRLPASLTYLECSHNRITSIHTLPPRIRLIVCAFNRIKELSPLPTSLRTLNFSANPIKRYPYTYDPTMHILISARGDCFKALGTEKTMVDDVKVFPSPIDPEIKESIVEHELLNNNSRVADEFDADSHNDILELVLEVQAQVDTRKFLSAIKEELITVTWHPRRVEAWCGVNFIEE
jgi:Leucine-rich repeat (LRR) protein